MQWYVIKDDVFVSAYADYCGAPSTSSFGVRSGFDEPVRREACTLAHSHPPLYLWTGYLPRYEAAFSTRPGSSTNTAAPAWHRQMHVVQSWQLLPSASFCFFKDSFSSTGIFHSMDMHRMHCYANGAPLHHSPFASWPSSLIMYSTGGGSELVLNATLT